jgi:hypothetical protein
MHGRWVRLTLTLSDADREMIERAAARMGTSPAEFARYAALRMAAQDAALDSSERTRASDDGSPLPSRRSLRRTIERAPFPTVEIVRQLEKHLGLQLLAITVGAPPDEVARWVAEETEPPPVYERRLREAHDAWQLVLSVESLETTRAWWMGIKDGLDDLSPAEAIAADRARDVMAVARYFVEAG